MRQHLEVLPDGTIRGRTPVGEDFIRICRLDRPNLVAFRRLMLDVLTFLGRKRDREAAELCRRYLGFPANLPNLAALKPPGGNSRLQGIERRRSRNAVEGNCPRFIDPLRRSPPQRTPKDSGGTVQIETRWACNAATFIILEARIAGF